MEPSPHTPKRTAAFNAIMIAATLGIWLLTLWAGLSVHRLDNFPDRSILLFTPRILLCLAACVGIGIIHLRTRRQLQRFDSPLTVIRSRLIWLLALIPVSATLAPTLPMAAANLFMLGTPAIIAWALLGLYQTPSSGDESARTQGRDWLRIVLIFSCLYWGLGWYFTRAVGEHQGDEGHYLIQAQSLYADQDLELHNNFDLKRTDPAYVHISPNSRNGRWYSWHTPGLSLLLAPTVPGGLLARHAVLGLIAGLGIAGAYRLSRELGAGRRSAWLSTLLLSCGAFWGTYSSRALPEVLGATLTTYGFLFCLTQREQPWRSTLAAILCIGYLPWAHTRFLPICLALVISFLFIAGRSSETRRAIIIRSSAMLLGCTLLLALFQAIQMQMFTNGLAYPVPTLLFSNPAGLWHTLSSNLGILHAFPVFACALVACLCLAIKRETRHNGLCVLLAFLSVWLTACATTWYTGGACMPGRFLVVVSPIVMAALARILSTSSNGFRALTIFLGLVPVTLFIAELTVLPQVRLAFVDPYTVEQCHPCLPQLLRLFHLPGETTGTFVAASLYVVALILGLRPTLPRIQQLALLAAVTTVFAVTARPLHDQPKPRYHAASAASILERRDMALSFSIVSGQATTTTPLLEYSDRFADAAIDEFKSVTTRDLGKLLDQNWISNPHVPINDWAERGYRWATLVGPFDPGRKHWAIHIDAAVTGPAAVEFVIREGSSNRFSQIYSAGTVIRETILLKAEGRGDLYFLTRFMSEPGEFKLNRIACSAYDPGWLERANLSLESPTQLLTTRDSHRPIDQPQ